MFIAAVAASIGLFVWYHFRETQALIAKYIYGVTPIDILTSSTSELLAGILLALAIALGLSSVISAKREYRKPSKLQKTMLLLLFSLYAYACFSMIIVTSDTLYFKFVYPYYSTQGVPLKDIQNIAYDVQVVAQYRHTGSKYSRTKVYTGCDYNIAISVKYADKDLGDTSKATLMMPADRADAFNFQRIMKDLGVKYSVQIENYDDRCSMDKIAQFKNEIQNVMFVKFDK